MLRRDKNINLISETHKTIRHSRCCLLFNKLEHLIVKSFNISRQVQEDSIWCCVCNKNVLTVRKISIGTTSHLSKQTNSLVMMFPHLCLLKCKCRGLQKYRWNQRAVKQKSTIIVGSRDHNHRYHRIIVALVTPCLHRNYRQCYDNLLFLHANTFGDFNHMCTILYSDQSLLHFWNTAPYCLQEHNTSFSFFVNTFNSYIISVRGLWFYA